jgi:hypothetical protein
LSNGIDNFLTNINLGTEQTRSALRQLQSDAGELATSLAGESDNSSISQRIDLMNQEV